VAIPREDYVISNRTSASMNKFIENAITWLANNSDVKIASDRKRPLSKYTEQAKVVSPKDLKLMETTNVYYIIVYTKLDDESVKAIQDFVENGGGLLIAGHCHACVYIGLKPSDLPGNK
jgi:phage FluMu gp28-like protein